MGTNDTCTLHNIPFRGIKQEEYDGNPNYTQFENIVLQTPLWMCIFHTQPHVQYMQEISVHNKRCNPHLMLFSIIASVWSANKPVCRYFHVQDSCLSLNLLKFLFKASFYVLYL